MFPLLVATGPTPESTGWLPILRVDAAFLHVTAYTVEAFIHRILLRQAEQINLTAALHLQKGLRLLRDRLSGQDDDRKISNPMLGIITKLTIAAHFSGDSGAAQEHMKAIRQIVDLRGGLQVLESSTLLIEIVR